MSDPSAGRPSTPEEQFTDEDVELIANAMFVGNRVHAAEGLTTPAWCELATVALAALAAANRLLPASSEHREEWSVWIKTFDGEDVTVYSHPTHADVAESWAREFQGLHGGVVQQRVWHAGEWVEVDGSPTDA